MTDKQIKIVFNLLIIGTIIFSIYNLYKSNDITRFNYVENNVITSKQTVSINRDDFFLTLDLEEYIIGVVASEMPASFTTEALKAQAVASRTYALNKINNNESLSDTVNDQVYKDNDELRKMWGENFELYYNKIKDAVLATEGQVITYNDVIINAFYHSTSNGYTEDPKDVWGTSLDYLKPVNSEIDKEASSYTREYSLPYNETNLINRNSIINIVRDETNNVSTITIDTITYTGVEFRNLLNLRSTDFEIILNIDTIDFITKGYGHGVGMSQYGANGLSKNGYTYEEILKHYYTDVDIKKL